MSRRDPLSRLQPMLQVVILAFALFCLGIAQDVFIPIASAMLLTFVLSPIVERPGWCLPGDAEAACAALLDAGASDVATTLGAARERIIQYRQVHAQPVPPRAE